MKEGFRDLRHPIYNSTANIIFPRLEKAIFIRSIIDTGGTEENIPNSGKLILGFFPHSGWSEPVTILPYVRQMRNQETKWITKIENQKLEPLLGSENFVYVDRDNFLKSEEEKVSALFSDENACVCTAFEGTRFWNPNDTDDVKPIAKFHKGIVYYAMKHKAQILIVPTLGAADVAPNFDRTIASLNVKDIKRDYYHILRNDEKHHFTVRFDPYFRNEEEMKEDADLARGDFIRKLIYHQKRVTEQAIGLLRKLDPEHPLGHYEK
jgi:1-acyl-sn-glycerol-3-phosphate acyltransferase